MWTFKNKELNFEAYAILTLRLIPKINKMQSETADFAPLAATWRTGHFSPLYYRHHHQQRTPQWSVAVLTIRCQSSLCFAFPVAVIIPNISCLKSFSHWCSQSAGVLHSETATARWWPSSLQVRMPRGRSILQASAAHQEKDRIWLWLQTYVYSSG